MVCFFPMKAYRGREGGHAKGMTFSPQKSVGSGYLHTLPCGICLGCKMDRAEGWAIRSAHEARMCADHAPGNPGSVFLTLTFDPEHLPRDNSVSLERLQVFVRALRYRLERDGVVIRVRYYAAAEYGELRGRAHYHLLLFGFRFPDRTHWTTVRGHRLYKSELLSLAWPYGNALIGDVTYKSARYVAGYVSKKVGGPKAADHYHRQSPVDGEWYDVEPEFSVMSKKPGLGKSWFEMFKSDVFPSDQVIIDGHPRKPPRYYEQMLSDEELEPVKRKRRRDALAKAADRTEERLAVRYELLKSRLAMFGRDVD